MDNRPIIGVTMGDPAGIGPEVVAKAVTNAEVLKVSRPLVVGDARVMKNALRIAKLSATINPLQDLSKSKFMRGAIDVLDLENADPGKIRLGEVSAAAGKAAVQYLEKAIDLALARQIDAISTAPMNKEAIHRAGYRAQGHTEILARRTKAKDYGMMFVSDELWVMLVTTHMPLNKVSREISKKKVLNTIRLAHQTLLKFRKKKPRIGVAGLNPHAGESGLFGSEEKRHIRPAVEEARRLGIDVKGPISPDAIFYLAHAGMFDLVVAMYHDQGLIPLKLLAFNKSVNVTVGLPIIRTSVDHGTGFDIVGKGWANPGSLIDAIRVAAMMSRSQAV